MVPNSLKYQLQMRNMIHDSGAVNQDVIKEDYDKPSQIRTENVVHKSLKSGRGIGEPKWHRKVLKVAA